MYILSDDKDGEEIHRKDLTVDVIEPESDPFELVGSVLKDLQEETRKQIIDWATKLIISETSELLQAQRKLPKYQSIKPKDDQFLDYDLDGTINTLMENPTEKYEALRVFTRARSGHSVLLIIDSSFSMSKRKIVMAAAAAATISHLINPADIGIVHFGSKGRILKRFEDEISPENLVEQIFSIVPQGLTNIYSGLLVGIEELGERKQQKHTIILLSDCDLNYGKMPSLITWRLQGLQIITFPPANNFIANSIAKDTQGKVYKADKIREIPLILKEILK